MNEKIEYDFGCPKCGNPELLPFCIKCESIILSSGEARKHQKRAQKTECPGCNHFAVCAEVLRSEDGDGLISGMCPHYEPYWTLESVNSEAFPILKNVVAGWDSLGETGEDKEWKNAMEEAEEFISKFGPPAKTEEGQALRTTGGKVTCPYKMDDCENLGKECNTCAPSNLK